MVGISFTITIVSVSVSVLLTHITAYGIRHYSNLTLPLNPPPQVGDFGRYAPKVESATVVEITVFTNYLLRTTRQRT